MWQTDADARNDAGHTYGNDGSATNIHTAGASLIDTVVTSISDANISTATTTDVDTSIAYFADAGNASAADDEVLILVLMGSFREPLSVRAAWAHYLSRRWSLPGKKSISRCHNLLVESNILQLRWEQVHLRWKQ